MKPRGAFPKKHGFCFLFITHVIGVVRHVADNIAVTRAGKLIEVGSRDDILDRPTESYTKQLLAAGIHV